MKKNITTIEIEKFGLSLEKKEVTLKILRQHEIFALLFFLIGIATLIILPIWGAYMYLSYDIANALLFRIPEKASLVFLSVYLLIISLVIFIAWMDHALDIGIITNYRIIDIDQDGVFSRKMSQVYFNNIEDVSGKQEGFFAHVFNFGDILVQSAGEQNLFLWKRIPDPFRVVEYILELRRASMKGLIYNAETKSFNVKIDENNQKSPK